MFYVSRRCRSTPLIGQQGGSLSAGSWVRAGAVCLGIALILTPVFGKPQGPQSGGPFHSPMPAGYSVVLLQPWRAELSILGMVECPAIEGAQKVSEGVRAFLISADGAPVKHYPREFSFRITATLRKTLLDGPSESLATSYDPRQFLLKLRFKLKVYHGLERRDIFPQSVTMIGMPGDVPYDERVFRVNFDVENIPVADRLVLDILSPENERVTHFTFGLL
jgi:hypothetical protein